MSTEIATPNQVAPKPVIRTAALWVGDLAPSVTEAMLDNLFASTGSKPVNVRVCRNVQTRESLGYAYVNYQNLAEAEKAMNDLNYHPIEGRRCRIMWSQRDPTGRRSQHGNVFIKNLGPEVDSKQLHDALHHFGTILSCKVSTDIDGKSRGYGFVHFEQEASAKEAIEKVHGMTFNDHVIQVMPYLSRGERSGPEWKNIYVKNFPKGFEEQQLLDLFNPFGKITSHVLAKDENGKSKGFAFICFESHPSAVAAIEKLNGMEMEGEAYLPSTKPAAEQTNKLHLYAGRAQTKQERERQKRDQKEASRRERAAKTIGCNLYVKNLNESVTSDELREMFAPFGTVTSAKVATDPSGASKLFGFVCFSSQDEASKAQQAMSAKMVQDKPLYVVPFKTKEERVAHLASRNTINRNAAMPNATQQQPFMSMINNNPMMAMMMSMASQASSMQNNPAMQAWSAQMRGMFQAMSRNFATPQANRPVQNVNPMNQLLNMMMQQQNGQQRTQPRRQQQQQPQQQQPRQPQANRPQAQAQPQAARPPQAPAAKSYRNAARNAEGSAPQSTNVAQQIETVLQQVSGPAPTNSSAFTSALAAADPSTRRQMLGEKIFPLIHKIDAARAGKITGMLLEGMEDGEILRLTESEDELAERVAEAQSVLNGEASA